MATPETSAEVDERGDFGPGDRILWAGNNGTVRHGRIIAWQERASWSSSKSTGAWFVEIDHDPAFGRKPNGFRTWFRAVDLIKEIPVGPIAEPEPVEHPVVETSAATVALVWESYDGTQIVTRAVPIPALSQPSLLSELLTRFGEIPGIRNPRIDTTRTVELGDVPTPRFRWTEDEQHAVPMFPAPRAALAVQCPKCHNRGGDPCESTGGGNRQHVPTHQARIDRVAGWTNAVQAHAEILVKAVGHYGYGNAGLFAAFEQAAAPIPVKATKPNTPKGVRLSEAQAEYIEWAVQRAEEPGVLYCPTGHLSGDHGTRQSILALEAKGIVVQDGTTDDGDRLMCLTAFGWQVYRQHRLIIRRLTDAQVDALEAQARQS